MRSPFDKVCKLCLALRDNLVALHLPKTPAKSRHFAVLARTVRQNGTLKWCRCSTGWFSTKCGRNILYLPTYLNWLLLRVVVRHIPLWQTCFALPILQQHKTDLHAAARFNHHYCLILSQQQLHSIHHICIRTSSKRESLLCPRQLCLCLSYLCVSRSSLNEHNAPGYYSSSRQACGGRALLFCVFLTISKFISIFFCPFTLKKKDGEIEVGILT